MGTRERKLTAKQEAWLAAVAAELARLEREDAMPWSVVNDSTICSEETPWAVVNDDSGETEGCHATEEEANTQVAALNAAEAEEEEEASEESQRFQIMVVPEGVRTTDGREIAPGALRTRELPIPVMMQTENPEWGGHAGAVLAGRIDELELVGGEWWGLGTYDSGEPGQELRRLVNEQMLRWVSADIEALEVEYLEEGDCSEEGFWDGLCTIVERVLDGRIMGATATPFPAFPTAVIIPEDADRQAATEDGRRAAEAVGAVAASPPIVAGAPPVPPSTWFDDPHLDGPTPLTVQSDGRVFGHAALWGTCHTGRPDACTTAPRSPSGYAYYRTGAIDTADGRRVAVGQITMATGHADLHSNHRAAASHYDNTGTAVADVATGEDEHGIWVAGSLRPGLTDDQVRTLSAAALSGDWRPIGGSLELVALLAVNVPGFPVPRAHSLVAGGAPQALVAAGIVRTDPVHARLAALERDVLRLRTATAPLMGLAVERLRHRVSPNGADVS